MKVTSESTKRAQGDARDTRRADGENGFRKAQLLFHFVQWGRIGVIGWPLRTNEDHLPKKEGRRWPDASTIAINTDNQRYCDQCVNFEPILRRCWERDW